MSFTILGPLAEGGVKLPLCSFKVPAGFPSPAADHIEQQISLDELMNIRATHVYLVSIDGESMQGVGIFEGDVAVVNCAREPAHGDVVVALLNNDPVCKRLCKRGKEVILLSENPKYPTDDVRLLTRAAVDSLVHLYRPGFNYSKAEVMLLNLCQPGEYTEDLFAASQPGASTKLMGGLDEINGRWGRGTLRSASVPSNPD